MRPISTTWRTPSTDAGKGVCQEAGCSCTDLEVAAAFHSRLVLDALEPFRAALEVVEMPPARIPVFCNTTAAPYPASVTEARDLLGEQLARPVAFVEEICRG